ncbi:O-antigen ligase family protein [Halorubrum halophilum]|uniref:O-antigen ligase family protein n=1 Tax=Halorubrum halophilum TaxID=413816 RepID=UPI00067967CD|nr:O-antigen ligase family protein [Halorubrum halophilum]
MTTARRYRHHDPKLLAVATVFFIGLFLPNSSLPLIIGYLAAAFAYTTILLYTLTCDTTITFPRWLLILTIPLIVGCYHVASNPTLGMLVRTLAFVSLAFINITYLPQVLPERYFYSVFARLAAVVVCIGLLPITGLPTTGVGFDLSLWDGQPSLLGVQFHPITSIFDNPNSLGFVALIGTICAAAERRLYQTQISLGLFGVSLFGLAASYYRTGWIALAAVAVLWIAYSVRGRVFVVCLTLLGGIAALVGLAITFKLLPGPEVLQSHDLGNRRVLWLAGVAVFEQRPVLGSGWGMAQPLIQPYFTGFEGYGVHNSFLRLFIETGLVGGGAYLLFHVLAATQAARFVTDERSVFLLGFVVAAVGTQMFAGFTLFGLSMRSAIVSLTIGYALRNTVSASNQELGA